MSLTVFNMSQANLWGASAYPPLLLHVFLLPLNIVRLREMRNLIKQVETAASGDLNIDMDQAVYLLTANEQG
jgi:hypothetical protein